MNRGVLEILIHFKTATLGGISDGTIHPLKL